VLFSFPGYKTAAISIQRMQAEAAADKIGAFIAAITSQVQWTTQLPWSVGTMDQRRFDALRLLRQVPAVTELSFIDASGLKQLRVSRLATDFDGPSDFSRAPEFTVAMEKKIYYSPVYFRRESEPHMTLSLAGARPDDGVSVAEVSLKFIWDIVYGMKVGERGDAYLIDAQGRLIAHPNISLGLRNMTQLPQVAAARAAVSAGAGPGPDFGNGEQVQAAPDILGRKVLTTYAPIAPLGWLVFVELPVGEAYEPLYFAMERSFGPLLGGLTLAFFGIAWLSSRSRRRASARMAGPWEMIE
jgi:hypothetical protein